MGCRLGKWITVLVLVLSLGLHWGLLQSVAWVSMVVSYSRSDTLTAALIKTFDGRHPCSLCLLVSEGKKSERQQPEKTAPENKLDFFLETSAAYCFLTRAPEPPRAAEPIRLGRVEPPPSPPPRPL